MTDYTDLKARLRDALAFWRRKAKDGGSTLELSYQAAWELDKLRADALAAIEELERERCPNVQISAEGIHFCADLNQSMGGSSAAIPDNDGHSLRKREESMHGEPPAQSSAAPLPCLVVTKGDGVPLPDQAAAIEQFKAQAKRSAAPTPAAEPTPLANARFPQSMGGSSGSSASAEIAVGTADEPTARGEPPAPSRRCPLCGRSDPHSHVSGPWGYT